MTPDTKALSELVERETWHQRFARLARAKRYAEAVAMLRAPAEPLPSLSPELAGTNDHD